MYQRSSEKTVLYSSAARVVPLYKQRAFCKLEPASKLEATSFSSCMHWKGSECHDKKHVHGKLFTADEPHESKAHLAMNECYLLVCCRTVPFHAILTHNTKRTCTNSAYCRHMLPPTQQRALVANALHNRFPGKTSSCNSLETRQAIGQDFSHPCKQCCVLQLIFAEICPAYFAQISPKSS